MITSNNWLNISTRLGRYLGLAAVGCTLVACSLGMPRENYHSGLVKFTSVEAGIAVYQAGFAALMQSIPEGIADQHNPSYALSVIKTNLYPYFYWGRVENSGVIRAQSGGTVSGVWALIFELDHPVLAERGPTMVTRKNNELNVIFIRPYAVTEKWAGIFLIHELSHAYNLVYKTGVSKHMEEYFAYDLEKRAYNLLTNNYYDALLTDVIHQYAIKDSDTLLDISQNKPSLMDTILKHMDASLGEPLSKSTSEQEMRDGFYVMSMVLRLSEMHNEPMELRIQTLNRVLATVSMF